MKVTAKLKNYRVSPRKARLVTDVARGLDVDRALAQMDVVGRKASHQIKKLIQSARANATNNFGLAADNLYVADIQVGEGVTYKRWLPRAYGRATGILKRTSNIIVTLDERVEGKGRKSREQVKKAIQEHRVAEEKKEAQAEKEEKNVQAEQHPTKIERVQPKAQSGQSRKMFRRKSV